jgi:hypothetical protein
MARPTEAEMVQLGPWPRGINNVSREDSLRRDELRAATNVDLERDGKTRRRDGQTLRYASSIGCRSIWSNGTSCVFVEGTSLKRLLPAFTASTLATGLHPSAKVAYAELAQWLFYADGTACGRVDLSTMTRSPWALETPLGPGNATALPEGGMAKATYLVTTTFRNADGEESGAPEAVSVEVDDGGGIALSNIPQPTQVGVSHVRVYLSRNGGDFEYHSEHAAGITQCDLVVKKLGKTLDTYLLEPMPATSTLAIFNGRMYGALGNMTVFSHPLRYGLYDPSENFLYHSSTPTLHAAVSTGGNDAGLFVGTAERTYFMAGPDPKKFQQSIAYGFGAVQGSMTYVPGSAFDPRLELGTDMLPVWLATNGVVCVGTAAGRVVPLTEGRYVAAVHARAGAIYREKNGIRQILLTGEGGEAQPLASEDVAVSVEVDNGNSA